MSRTLRKFLVASVVLLHTALTLCGPCLHSLPGFSHETGLCLSNAQVPNEVPARPSHDSSDVCPVCHFVAQAQLPVQSSSIATDVMVAALELAAPSTTCCFTPGFLASPRAPPVPTSGLS